MGKIGRNAPCPCGSGKKYKKCCLAKEEQEKNEQREQIKTEEKRSETLRREKKELFEPTEGDDFREDGEFDEEEEFEDDDSELIDDDEDEGSDDDETPQWPKADIPQMELKFPELSEEEDRIADQWHERYEETDDIDEKLAHLESLMERHPGIVEGMGLQNDVVIDLVCGFAAEDRHAEAVDLMERIHREYPAAYKDAFGFFDLHMVAYKIATGKKHEIPPRLEYFKQYPDHAPDELFELIDLLQLTNCIEILEDFIPRVYLPVCSSSKIIGGRKILETVVELCYAPFAKPDYTRKDAEKISERLLALEIPMDKEYCSPESVEKELSKIFAPLSPWNIDTRGGMKKLIETYEDVAKNFRGYAYLRKGMDWTAAAANVQMAFAYLTGVVPEGKRPKEPFVFSKSLILETASDFSSLFMGMDTTKFFGMLNAVYHFADYLGDSETVSSDDRDAIQKWCMEIHEETFPKFKDHFEEIVFRRFPLECTGRNPWESGKQTRP